MFFPQMLKFPWWWQKGGRFREDVCDVDAKYLVNAGEDSGKPRLVEATGPRGPSSLTHLSLRHRV